jgi:hypothetical protein
MAEAIVDWFLQHYDDPAESCPVDEGEYYFFDGPCYARDEIEAHCRNAPADAVDQAVKQLEEGGVIVWSPIMSDEGDDGVDIYFGKLPEPNFEVDVAGALREAACRRREKARSNTDFGSAIKRHSAA